ncbi:unnamed protein product [Dovyalis caffra]|uniref:Uncharacterized protein n=1 Tax=Dovyalis caffra TaxID=77055 RepID=A0AAV1SLP2_9ROSI|nr:unnamed protein product [Dovyalis caffra]
MAKKIGRRQAMNGGLIRGSNPRVHTQAIGLSCRYILNHLPAINSRILKEQTLVSNNKEREENMAIRTSCCLNLSPPSSASTLPSSSTKNSQVAWFKNEKWRSQCVLGMACMVIGSVEMGGDLVSGHENLAMAREMQAVVESKENWKGPRWSDKRICPPWHQNSLETIVPENLPRPSSAHRRWPEVVGFSKNNAPAVKVIVIEGSNGCFSM